jgi:hypothetical protein
MAGFILGAAMLVPVYAQQPPASGAQGSVTITEDEKAKAGAEAAPAAGAEAAPKIQVPKQAVTNRDPFVYQLGEQVQVKRKKVVAAPPPRKPGEAAASKDAAGAAAAAKGGKAKDAAPVVEVAPPAVTVTGIINGPQNRAILTSPNQSYIVKVGDKLGDYKVSAISAKAVSFKYKDKTFKVVMEDEFTAAKK